MRRMQCFSHRELVYIDTQGLGDSSPCLDSRIFCPFHPLICGLGYSDSPRYFLLSKTQVYPVRSDQ